MLPDGRLASGSYDNTIRLWDVTAGAETARLEGHSGWVAALCMLPDAETARLEIDAPITSMITLPTGRLVAGDLVGWLHWLEVVD
jgi:WD40 repeat protein